MKAEDESFNDSAIKCERNIDAELCDSLVTALDVKREAIHSPKIVLLENGMGKLFIHSTKFYLIQTAP